jgi:hypothetical protein
VFLYRANTLVTVLTAAYEAYTPLEPREPSPEEMLQQAS